MNFEVYIFSTTLYYYTEYWILFFKVIIEFNFNIKCNLNGNLKNYKIHSFVNWFNWFWKYILVYLKVFSNRNVLKEFKECFKLNFKEKYSVRPFLSLGNNIGDEFWYTSSTFIFESHKWRRPPYGFAMRLFCLLKWFWFK